MCLDLASPPRILASHLLTREQRRRHPSTLNYDGGCRVRLARSARTVQSWCWCRRRPCRTAAQHHRHHLQRRCRRARRDGLSGGEMSTRGDVECGRPLDPGRHHMHASGPQGCSPGRRTAPPPAPRLSPHGATCRTYLRRAMLRPPPALLPLSLQTLRMPPCSTRCTSLRRPS